MRGKGRGRGKGKGKGRRGRPPHPEVHGNLAERHGQHLGLELLPPLPHPTHPYPYP